MRGPKSANAKSTLTEGTGLVEFVVNCQIKRDGGGGRKVRLLNIDISKEVCGQGGEEEGGGGVTSLYKNDTKH